MSSDEIKLILEKLTSMESWQANMESRLVNMESRLVNMESRLVNMESRLVNMESRQANIEQGLINLGTRSEALETRSEALENRIGEIQKYLSTFSTLVQAQFEKTQSLIRKLDRKFDLLNEDVMEVRSDQRDANRRMDKLEDKAS
jgi:chromosome segregation ATPase